MGCTLYDDEEGVQTLECRCTGHGGAKHTTTLQLPPCEGRDIGNHDGALKCHGEQRRADEL